MGECLFYELSGCAFEPRCSHQTVGNSDQVNLLNITEIICQFISGLPGLCFTIDGTEMQRSSEEDMKENYNWHIL